MNKPRGTRVALYVRTSKAGAEEERQVAAAGAWTARHGLALSRTYRDLGGKRHESKDPKRRAGFARLLADVRAGLWDIVLVEEQSRFGALGREFDYYMHIFEEASCELWAATADRCLSAPDVASVVLSAVAAAGNRTEVEQLATRTLGGKLSGAREGRYQGGPIPYGMAIQARTPAGVPVWTLETADDGRRVQVFADGREHWHDEKFLPGSRQVRGEDGKRRRAEALFLVPTRLFPGRLEVVRQIARWYLDEHVSPGTIARRLNDSRRLPPGGRPWWWGLVARVLRTPYAGRACYGRRTRHRYATIEAGVPALSPGKGKLLANPREQWVWSEEPVYEPVIDVATQEAIWAKLAAEEGQPRKTRSPEYVLSGLVVCGNCGKVASGMPIRREGRKFRRVYRCADYARYKGASPRGCKPLDVDQEDLLAIVGRWIDETGRTLELATDAGEDGLLRALFDQRSGLKRELAGLRAAMEGWLADSLAEVMDLDELPGSGAGDLLDLHGWAWHGASARTRARLAELDAEHEKWFDLLARMPTEGTRQKAAARLREIEEEAGRIRRATETNPGREFRRLLVELQRTQATLARARRELSGDEPRKVAAALRGLIARLIINWTLVDKGGRRVARIDSVTIRPVEGEAAVVDGVGELCMPRRSRRPRSPIYSDGPAPSASRWQRSPRPRSWPPRGSMTS
jgi:DNA invertase Pin-like site-specific DNA recombinase